MRILHVASEVTGLIKTGGLADVVAGLARAQLELGDDVRVLLPAYPGSAQLSDATVLADLGDPLGTGPTRLLEGRLPGTDVKVWLVEAESLYARPGGPYLDPKGNPYSDNQLRFGLLGRVAAFVASAGTLLGWRSEVVHAHDWQASLAPATLHWWGGSRPGTVTTIHNLRFQGRFAPSIATEVGLPRASYALEGAEAYGTFSFLKAGIVYADQVTTVSPTYAEEIQTESGGEGLHGLLQSRTHVLHGILNGIDTRVWDPSTDPALPVSFDAKTLGRRAANKDALQRAFGLEPNPDVAVLGLVSRLTPQKGIDVLLQALPRLLKQPVQVALLGSGQADLEDAIGDLTRRLPGRVGAFIGYDEALSHRVFAGADIITIPSRFEPCGLTQMYAMRYGAVPVVRYTGGLADTVSDVSMGGCGFTFDALTADAVAHAIERALHVFTDQDLWSRLQRQGMHRDFGWANAAARYRDVYSAAVGSSTKM